MQIWILFLCSSQCASISLFQHQMLFIVQCYLIFQRLWLISHDSSLIRAQTPASLQARCLETALYMGFRLLHWNIWFNLCFCFFTCPNPLHVFYFILMSSNLSYCSTKDCGTLCKHLKIALKLCTFFTFFFLFFCLVGILLSFLFSGGNKWMFVWTRSCVCLCLYMAEMVQTKVLIRSVG